MDVEHKVEVLEVTQLQQLKKCENTIVACGSSFSCIVGYNAMKRKKKHRNQRSKPVHDL